MVARMPMRTTRRRWPATGAVLLMSMLALAGCNRSQPSRPAASAAAPQTSAQPAATAPRRAETTSAHDLSTDEAMGGHTLARHVGRTDDQLRDRLEREPDISSASTYNDRATAEDVVGAALSSAPKSFDTWQRREGRRPNFVLHFNAHRVIGRSLGRGQAEARPCENALVVVRWDDRRRQFYVLTSYPEERR